jgi:hypothetical protein
METMTDTIENTMQLELNRTKAQLEVTRNMLSSLRAGLQLDLTRFAEDYLTAGDEDYRALNDLMLENDLEGLKRTFSVTIEVSYTVEVEVEASSEDEARDLVDNDVVDYLQDNIDLSDYNNTDLWVSEV